jgi:hypothetical protein
VDVAVSIHGPEDGTIVDIGRSQPVVEASYGAVPRAAIGDADLPTCPLLIGLGPRQGDYQTLADMLNVGSV